MLLKLERRPQAGVRLSTHRARLLLLCLTSPVPGNRSACLCISALRASWGDRDENDTECIVGSEEILLAEDARHVELLLEAVGWSLPV